MHTVCTISEISLFVASRKAVHNNYRSHEQNGNTSIAERITTNRDELKEKDPED